MSFKYQHAVLGGTFDHLHAGHNDLLNKAFELSGKVTIGLATEKIYARKFLPDLIQPYGMRLQEINGYLTRKTFQRRARITELSDIYGPTLDDNDIDAIFVTDNTLSNAQLINEQRIKKGMPPLAVINVPLKKDENGEIITSEKIRLGRISRDGLVYMNIFKEKGKLTMPPELRAELRRPIGNIIKDVKNLEPDKTQNSILISVGDIVTKSLKEISLPPDIEVIDLRTRRQAIDPGTLGTADITKLKNEPGIIRKNVVDFYLEAIDKFLDKKQKQSIIIDGEEDLLTLPAILLAPLHSTVCYGQFDLNAMVVVTVTEEKKQLVYTLLQKFQ